MDEQTLQTPPNNSPQEIDLFSALSRMFNAIGRGIKRFASWLKRLIQKFFLLIFKNIWLFLLLAVIGGFVGWGKVKLSKPFYESEMLVEAKIVSRAQIADRVNALQRYITDKNYSALSRELHLTENDVREIFSIKAEPVNIKGDKNYRMVKRTTPDGKEETVTEEITDFDQQLLQIKVRFWNSAAISKMGEAIENFINNDAYVLERWVIVRENNLARQNDIQSQIDQLTLFQEKNIQKSSNVMVQGNSPLMIQNEERTYVAEILDLKNQILALKRDFELIKPLTIVQPFFTFENPVDKMLKNILLMILLFCGIGFIALVGREGWRRI